MRRIIKLKNPRFVNLIGMVSNQDRIIVDQAKKEGNIIYGARSIQKQIGIFSRGTKDWDIFSKKPKKSATNTETALDKAAGDNQFYVKAAKHPGTWKVMSDGFDKKPGTKDDFGVVDYTEFPKPAPKVKTYGGVKYRALSEEKKAKLKSLRDKAYKFRWKKDREDYDRIKLAAGRAIRI